MMTPNVIKDLRAIAALKNEGTFNTPEATNAKALAMEASRARHAAATAAAAAPLAGPLTGPSARPNAAKQRPHRINLVKRMQAAAAEASGNSRARAMRAVAQRTHHNLERKSQDAANAAASRKRKSAPGRLEIDGRALDSEYCADCAVKLDSIVGLAANARRTAAELKHVKTDQKDWNNARLMEVLVTHVFDPLGNFVVCTACLMRRFCVGHSFIARAHKLAIQWRHAPVVVLTK